MTQKAIKIYPSVPAAAGPRLHPPSPADAGTPPKGRMPPVFDRTSARVGEFIFA